jgi:mono/diheme cytochrome c family protein
MKKVGRVLLMTLGVVVVAILLGLAYLKTALPNTGDPEHLVIQSTPEMVEHGAYLANHVMVCMDCHSKRDWSRFSGPLVPNTLGQGGEAFNQNMKFPGNYVAKNITPHKLASWSDGEIFRAITTGVSKDGHALFPIMPYTHYGTLDRKDIEAVIAYLRTLEPIEVADEPSSSDFPMNFIINTIPQEAKFVQKPKKSDVLAYGEYMVNAAACYDCHTNQDKGKFIGEDFAGGMEFPFPDGSVVRAPNITPHATGIGSWTEEQFVERFKQYVDSSYEAPAVKSGEFQTVMPWTMYGGMNEEDLKAIYAYLKSVEPVENTVVRFAAVTE